MLSRHCSRHPPRWLLLSDIHFRLQDIERTRRTAEWIVSLLQQTPGISRVVVCGDVLTSRSMQPTAVVSAAYRFFSDLSHSVPHINVILGNHDLAYRRDYGTTALEAMKMSRLRPFISLHDEVGKHTWDGRRVLVMPFREDQNELTSAVASLDPDEAAQTVGFAHLAINRAVTQRHIVREDGDLGYSVRYRGLTGPHHFSPLSRTFTGHFHSHQTILQSSQHAAPVGCEDRLKGSVTYLGSPLQLNWADLCDEDRGVVLFNPETLEHELVVNPHAVGYITVQGSKVLDEDIDTSIVQGKHVMIIGKLTQFQYWTARDKLLSLGAQSVREPRPTAPTMQNGSSLVAYHILGASVPASDRGVNLNPVESSYLPADPSRVTMDEQNASSRTDELQPVVNIDPVEHVRGFVDSLADESMDKEKMIHLGQRLILASESTAFLGDDAGYKVLLDPTISIPTQGDSSNPTNPVFVAKPRSIVMSNFLGVQGDCAIDFDGDLGQGLTLVVGNNGSGKSTLIEAIVWCQFGRCIRKGLAVGDVVNDIVGKDCMVRLSFANGYAITRYRKHKVHGNRVVVSIHGVDQPQFEHGEARATQAALDELLGIDYEGFIRTVVLGHESAASFLSSTPIQRHDLIESTLGLSRLETSADLSRKMLREIDKDVTGLRGRIAATAQSILLVQGRITNGNSVLQGLHREVQRLRETVRESEKRDRDLNGHQAHPPLEEEDLRRLNERLEELKSAITRGRQAVNDAQSVVKEAEITEEVDARQLISGQRIESTKNQIQVMRDNLSRLITLHSSHPDSVTMKHLQTLRNLAQAISWLHRHALSATDYLSPDNLVNKMALRFIRTTLHSLEQLSIHLNEFLDQLASIVSQQQRESMGDTAQSIEMSEKELAETESTLTRLLNERDEAHSRVALDRGLDERYVRSLSDRLPKINVRNARRQLSFSLDHLSGLLREQGDLHEQQAAHQRKRADMSEMVKNLLPLMEKIVKKEQEIATYKQLVEEETSVLAELRSTSAAIESEIETVMETRALFAFWEESLSRRRAKSATASTFRGYVLDKGLQELNTMASKILLTLYENTHHARELTKGMLRTMIAADSEYDQDGENAPSTALLDQTLGVSKNLSYAKRSGGERKRIDLAVFFALVQTLQARSAHRARYILVDEAFDSLDVAGQAAVLRWCSQLMAWTDFQLVITHSEYLASPTGHHSNEEDGVDIETRYSVLNAKMTNEGTKFLFNMV